jgi:hypothetical protein
VRDIVYDDDAHQREFVLDVEMGAHKFTVTVLVAEFSRMEWVLKHLGPHAILYPGKRQHARAAIQSLSGSVVREQIFSTLGWRKHATDWIYVQSNGAIGAAGIVPGAEVRLFTSTAGFPDQDTK